MTPLLLIPKNGTVVENIEKIMIEFIDLFIDTICMQKLIVWELNDDNFITCRRAQNRDNNSEPLTRYFENKLKKCNINFNAASAILIGGIYYLIIHRKMGTFNLINFSTKEGVDLLKKTIIMIVRKIFDVHKFSQSMEVEQNTINIANELLKKRSKYRYYTALNRTSRRKNPLFCEQEVVNSEGVIIKAVIFLEFTAFIMSNV